MVGDARSAHASRCRDKNQIFPLLLISPSILPLLSWHFCAMRGIFPRTRPHLTNPGAMAGPGAA